MNTCVKTLYSFIFKILGVQQTFSILYSFIFDDKWLAKFCSCQHTHIHISLNNTLAHFLSEYKGNKRKM